MHGVKSAENRQGNSVNFHKVTPYYVNARPTGVYAWLDAYEKTDLMSDSSRSSIQEQNNDENRFGTNISTSATQYYQAHFPEEVHMACMGSRLDKNKNK